MAERQHQESWQRSEMPGKRELQIGRRSIGRSKSSRCTSTGVSKIGRTLVPNFPSEEKQNFKILDVQLRVPQNF